MSLGTQGFRGHGEGTWPSNCHRESHHLPLIGRRPHDTGEARAIVRLVGTTDVFATVLDYAGAQRPA
jgi:arylsulfatase A-like enzyme